MTAKTADAVSVEQAEAAEREAAQHLADLHGGIIGVEAEALAQAEHRAEHTRLVAEAARRIEADRSERARRERVAELVAGIEEGPRHAEGLALLAEHDRLADQLAALAARAERWERALEQDIRELAGVVRPGDPVEARRDAQGWAAVLPSTGHWRATPAASADMITTTAVEAMRRTAGRGRRLGQLEQVPGAQAAQHLQRRLDRAARVRPIGGGPPVRPLPPIPTRAR